MQGTLKRIWETQAGDWGLALKNLLFPVFCQSCGERLLTDENGYFCARCWESSPLVEHPVCPRCGRPHETMLGVVLPNDFLCADCRETPNPHIRHVFSPARFEGSIETAIKLLKFHQRCRLAGPLGLLLSEYIQKEMDVSVYDLVLPVPLHSVRERSRGFNQSRLLVDEILPLFSQSKTDASLQRIRPTKTQSTLPGDQRKANIRGAFAVLGDGCKGKSILLVDDVITTGGTVTECARVLRRAGALHVDVLTVAVSCRQMKLFV